jgi:hypothetical protein
MKTLLTISSLLAVSVLGAAAATEENINETRPAQAGGKLVVDVDFGNLEVATGDSDKVVVNGYRKVEASSKEKEKEYIDSAPITVTTEGNVVIVRARREKKGWIGWNWGWNSKMEAHYAIRVPPKFDADVDTSGGKITLNDLTGTIKADTSGGNLTLSRLHGPIQAATSGGHIEIAACEGAIHTETSGGGIKSSGGSGSLDAHSSGGTITVEDFGGDTKVETSGGRLDLKNIRGKLTGETSGGAISALLPSPVPGDVKLETSAGAIDVSVPANAGLTLDAETSAGRVTSELPVTTTRGGRDELKGTINGGGKSLHLRTSAGSISIKSAPVEAAGM